MKKTHLIRINAKDHRWLEIYDLDIGYEWTTRRAEAFVMTQQVAGMRLTTVRRQFPNAIIEPR